MLLDSRDLASLAAKGMTLGEIASALGQPYFRVRKSAWYYGIEVKPAQRGPKPAEQATERNQRMALMYRQGLSLAKIGQTFGVTRERVRQVLKGLGLTRAEGGASKARAARESVKQAQKEARALARHGISWADYKECQKAGLIHAYRNQKRSADARGIVWALNFAQWLDVWRTSGKLDQRGRGKGKYVMSRIRDAGGYEVGNVHIQLGTENSREAVEQWRGKTKPRPGVYHLYPGLSTPYMAKVGRKYLGLYATEEEALRAREDYANANGLQMLACGRVCTTPTPHPLPEKEEGLFS